MKPGRENAAGIHIGAGLSGYVAELGSAFLCAALGIVPTVRHGDYLASWLAVLREDNRAIFRAASAASKAADWLLSRYREAVEAAAAERIAA
ncbi:zincin-like metallopeptidase domain-containing protein [Sphingomonas sp. ACRSK]|uniref:zincin-like metallopeptidase domain-containing protein n=1 Tax=Sphingomonas sp. ACRSK TaxID=2918213 RepID=UPI001EF48521|nr:zincin-like metallopeptidase domain-containing protein [Sphingomonas sp. ACRSK]MCG7349426.1 zincin-like metallopeptidase domain-containing protein [Sphingomonas sp. ACRSK]